MAYPRPKQVRHKPSTEINPSIVNIRFSPPFPDSLSGFYVNGGSQSLRRGLTAYHPGSPNEILPQFDRNFNQDSFSWNMWKAFQYQSQNNLTEQKERLKIADFTNFPVQMSVTQTRSVLCCCFLLSHTYYMVLARFTNLNIWNKRLPITCFSILWKFIGIILISILQFSKVSIWNIYKYNICFKIRIIE